MLLKSRIKDGKADFVINEC